MGSDLSVVNAARVSFHKESALSDDGLTDKDKRLINYLAEHNHWTPFAHTALSFRIKAPIFVARQLGKHQVGLVWNEVSRRYVDDEPEFYFPGEGMWRSRAENVKQGSGNIGAKLRKLYEGQEDLWGDHDNKFDPDMHVSVLVHEALVMYKDLLASGICPEQARMVLPQSMMTEWIWSGSLAAFARVCKLRLDSHTQKETQEVADKIYGYCMDKFPNSFEALMRERV